MEEIMASTLTIILYVLGFSALLAVVVGHFAMGEKAGAKTQQNALSSQKPKGYRYFGAC